MEIHKKLESITGSTDSRSIAGKLGSDITESTRESIREFADSSRLDRKDRIELSQTAKSLKGHEGTQSGERAKRVEALRAAYEAGTLNDPELVERAARGLMTGI